jgi:hypothetical protein
MSEQNADPANMHDGDDIGSSEKDMCGPEMECAQEPAHPNITTPKKEPSELNKALGAGTTYKPASY